MNNKLFLFSILLLCLVSCASVPEGRSVITSFATTTTQGPEETKPFAKLSPTPPIISVVQRNYNSAEWSLLYDKDTVQKVVVDKKQQIWMLLDRGEVAFLDDKKWVLFTKQDYGLSGKPYDLAVAPDGSVWIAGQKAISHYQNGYWKVFPSPSVGENPSPQLAIAPTGEVWFVTPGSSNCCTDINVFNGISWNILPNPQSDRPVEAQQVVFSSEGMPWASFAWLTGIGKYDGSN